MGRSRPAWATGSYQLWGVRTSGEPDRTHRSYPGNRRTACSPTPGRAPKADAQTATYRALGSGPDEYSWRRGRCGLPPLVGSCFLLPSRGFREGGSGRLRPWRVPAIEAGARFVAWRSSAVSFNWVGEGGRRTRLPAVLRGTSGGSRPWSSGSIGLKRSLRGCRTRSIASPSAKVGGLACSRKGPSRRRFRAP
jgi:hypothetical protein